MEPAAVSNGTGDAGAAGTAAGNNCGIGGATAAGNDCGIGGAAGRGACDTLPVDQGDRAIGHCLQRRKS